jgi:glycosyltransferase involved in cell wall biosynthesis
MFLVMALIVSITVLQYVHFRIVPSILHKRTSSPGKTKYRIRVPTLKESTASSDGVQEASTVIIDISSTKEIAEPAVILPPPISYPSGVPDIVSPESTNQEKQAATASNERSKGFDPITKEFASKRNALRLPDNYEWINETTLPHPDFSMTVNVITYNRPKSLKRLVESLLNAEYYGHKIRLNIHIDQGADTETVNYVKQVRWPYGEKRITSRFRKSGLVLAIIESWYPAHGNDYVMLAEDDIEVSKYWYLWILETMKQYRYTAPTNRIQHSLDSNIFGISLYTPRESELSLPRFTYYPDQNFKESAWLLQIPCSWGAVYFPEHWIFYREYIEMRRNIGKKITIPKCECNGWKDSWVKFYTELAFMKGWSMVYPNFINQTSFSTNHLEPGVHIKKEETSHTNEQFTVPLAKENIIPVGNLPLLEQLPVIDYSYHRFETRKELTQMGQSTWNEFLIDLNGKENAHRRH